MGALVFCGLLFFTTKRFACWAQNCFWVLREGVARLCAACCVLWRKCQWPYSCVGAGLCWSDLQDEAMCPLFIAGKRQKAEVRGREAMRETYEKGSWFES